MKFFELVKKIFRFLFTALFTSALIASVLISIPYTEKYYKGTRYDLTLKNELWTKEYVLLLAVKNKDIPEKDKKTEETKDIIYRRLVKYGVRDIEIEEIESQKKDEARLKIKVKSDLDPKDVDTLVTERYYLRFVIAKEDVNFEDENNPYSQFQIENYISTPYTRHDFRTVYLTKLKSTSGEYAYFAIFKPWENKLNEFYQYFDKLAGKRGGISSDNLVTPIYFPTTLQQGSNSMITRQPFAIGMTVDDSQANILDILYNSGTVPLNYIEESVTEISVINEDINYLRILLGLSGFTLITSIYTYFARNRNNIIENLIPIIATLTIWISILKLLAIPMSLDTIYITSSLFLFLSLLLTYIEKFKKYALFSSTLILFSNYILLGGYVKEISLLLLILLISLAVIQNIVSWYIKLVRNSIS